MRRKLVPILGLLFCIICVGFVACKTNAENKELTGLTDFTYMVGYNAVLPQPDTTTQFGDDLDYTLIVTKPNGVEAKTRKSKEGYILNIEKEGVYTLDYKVVTPEGELYTKKITMTAVLDTENPVISGMNGEVGGLSIGDTLIVPEIHVSDNSMSEPYNASVEVSAVLTDPQGEKFNLAVGGSTVLNSYGEYTLTYSATDGAHNNAEEKVFPFTVSPLEDAYYTIEYYKENLDGTYTLDTTVTDSAMAMSLVTAPEKEYNGYLPEWNHAESMITARVQADGSTVLKAYYKRKLYTVLFNSNGGSEVEHQLVKHGGKIQEPTIPTKDGTNFQEWFFNGNSYNFNLTVRNDMELQAVWEEKSRYGLLLSDGTNVLDWRVDRLDMVGDGSFIYAEDEAFIEAKNVDGEDVISYTIKNTASGKAYPNDAPLVYLDREGEYANIISEVSRKKYFGFRVYSSVEHCEFLAAFMVDGYGDNGLSIKRMEYVYRLKKGWNEIIVNLPMLAKAKGLTWDAEHTIYRVGLGVRGNIFVGGDAEATQQTGLAAATFYLDDIYATNYNLSDIIDFESCGDLNRYEFAIEGNYSDRDYGYAKYDFPAHTTTDLSFEMVEGESVLKMEKQAGKDYSVVRFLNASGTDGVFGRWFTKDLSQYSYIEIRVMVESKDGAFFINGERVTNNETDDSGKWVTYRYDLSKLTDKSNVPHLCLELWGADVAYVDYIKFVK